MKKIVALILAVLFVSTCAFAESDLPAKTLPILPGGQGNNIVPVSEREPMEFSETWPATDTFVLLAKVDPELEASDTYEFSVDLDGDGTIEEGCFQVHNGEDFASYSIDVNSLLGSSDNAYFLSGDLYVGRFSGVQGAILLTSDYGMSNDNMSYIWHYVRAYDGEESLELIGEVEGLPEEMLITGNNSFSSYVRAEHLMTWYRLSDFVIATGYFNNEDMTETAYGVAEVPRDIYPVGACVTLKADLPLLISRTDETVCWVVEAGESAILAASDDCAWVYISVIDNAYDEPSGGWVRMDPDSWDMLIVGGTPVPASEMMDGLTYAD